MQLNHVMALLIERWGEIDEAAKAFLSNLNRKIIP